MPEDSGMRRQWLDLLNVKDTGKKLYACMMHFDDESRIRRTLPKDTLPTVNLRNCIVVGSAYGKHFVIKTNTIL